MSYELTEEAVTEYRREGFTVVRGAFELETMAKVNDEIGALFRTQAVHAGFRTRDADPRRALLENARYLLARDVSRYIATMRTTQDLPSVHEVLTSPTTVGLAKGVGIEFPIISTRASVHLMVDELKVPDGYHKSPAHQDWQSSQGSLDNVVIWIPTTPVSCTSNPLEVIPGSHVFGLLPTKTHIMTPEVADVRVHEEDFEPISMGIGDVIIFSAFLVHRTGDKGDGLVRIALSTRFNNAVEPSYVERGYSTPYRYTYQLNLLKTDFPRPEDVKAVFDPAELGKHPPPRFFADSLEANT